MEWNEEKLVNAIKEGFKAQNEVLASTIKSNKQIQQGQRKQLQYIPLNQVRAQAQMYQNL